jgi:signal transduction histidine kinase
MTAPPIATQADPRLISVLLADDSGAMRTLARYALSAKHGFRLVAEAENGVQVLSLMKRHDPDVVVLDIEMPVMNGIQALTELSRTHPGVPVIMLTGNSDREMADQAMALGASAYVEKGNLALLSETIRDVTRAYRLRGAPDEAPTPAAAGNGGRTVATVPDAASAATLRRLEYVVGHDFAEPARIMTGFASLLETHYSDALDTRGQAFLAQITGAADRLQRMIDDLLVYSRAGQTPPRAERLDVQARVLHVRRELRDTIEAKRAEVTVEALPKAVADRDMVATVFQHLLQNALTFNRSPTPRVLVQGRLEGERAIYTVKDNGIGISPARTDEAFELCRRLNTRDEFPGTGMGLAVCRRLVTMMGGSIALTSPADGGCVVTLILPASLD